MAEPASLKSFGRFHCKGEQMFYELILTEKHYLIKYYNQFGKLKLIRPIKFPTQGVEIHTAGNYIFCYLHSHQDQTDSEIFMIKLDNCKLDSKTCKLHLSCKTADTEAIKQIYFNDIESTILFSDQRLNIYLLDWTREALECKKIYTNDQPIVRIQVDKESNILLVTKQRSIKQLKMNWQEKQVVVEKLLKEQRDYYFENGFEAKLNNDNFLTIKEQGQFNFSLYKNSQLIFYSQREKFLIVFDPLNNTFLTIVESIFKIYGTDEEQRKHIPKILTQNNFLVNYKKDSNRNIIIQLRVYLKEKGQFECFQYSIPEMGKKCMHVAFLKRNIANILHFNGLIDPLHQGIVAKAIKELEDNAVDFQKSRYFGQSQSDQNFIDLACKLLRYGLQYFPKEMTKIIQKVKAHIANIKTSYCILQTRRLFEYSEIILSKIAEELIFIYEEINRIKSTGGQMSNSQESQQENKLKGHLDLLENTIKFLQLLVNQLAIELHSLKQKQNEEGHQIDILSHQMKYYKDVNNSAKSLFLIVKMLEDKDIDTKISYHFQKVIDKKTESIAIWQKYYHNLSKMEYPPLLLHEHFKTISHLTLSNKPTFSQLIHYLLENRSNLFQIAYFYQLVTKSASVPFLNTDLSDLIENILVQVPVIPKPIQLQLAEQKDHLRSSIQQNEDILKTQNLLHKMAGAALKLQQYSFIKYMIQLSIVYEAYPLAIMLIHSEAFTLSKDDQIHKKQHIFMIKSLLLAGKFNLAYLYTLKLSSKNMFRQFLKWVKINGNLADLLQCKLEKQIVQEDQQQLLQWLDLTPEQEEKMKNLISSIE